MFDMAQPNAKPGICCKCNGSGLYTWVSFFQGRGQKKSGPCHSCGATGKQTIGDIRRNEKYNEHKLASLFAADFASAARRDEDYADEYDSQVSNLPSGAARLAKPAPETVVIDGREIEVYEVEENLEV